MRTCVVIFLITLLVLSADLGSIKYATRIRNFSIESETRTVIPYNTTLFESNKDRVIAGCMNVTKDFLIKYINAKVHRCQYENSNDCELFQNLTFTRHLKAVTYLKNQVWSPLLGNITPRFSDLPLVKKHLYCTSSANLDTKAIVTQYPQFINYFWRVMVVVNDHNNKKPLVFKFDGSVFPYSEGNGKRDRNTTRRS